MNQTTEIVIAICNAMSMCVPRHAYRPSQDYYHSTSTRKDTILPPMSVNRTDDDAAGSHSRAADTLPRCDASLFKFFRRDVQGVPASHVCGEADGKLQKNIYQSAITFSGNKPSVTVRP